MISVAVITRHQASAMAMINLLQDTVPISRVIFERWSEDNGTDESGGLDISRVIERLDYYRRRMKEQLEGRRQLEIEGLDRIFGARWREIERAPRTSEINPGAWSRAVELLREDPPDLILVFGTSLIPEEVTGLARIAALNIHGGLSPHYRGQNCTHFAIINDDFENIGVTVHLVRKAIDGGEIIAQRRPEIIAFDNEYTLNYKLHLLGFQIYAEIIERLSAGEKLAPVTQPKDVGLLLMNRALTEGHVRLVRSLIDGGAIARHLERAAAGKTRPKPITLGPAMVPGA